MQVEQNKMIRINHGVLMNKIIMYNRNSFDYAIYREIDFFSNIESNMYQRYLKDSFSQFNAVKKEFPLLKITMLPSNIPSSLYISGYLIRQEFITMMGLKNKDDYQLFGMKIVAIIPIGFKKTGIRVFDANNIIDYSRIPYEYYHFRSSPKGRIMLCTHKDEKINSKNAIYGVLLSAEHLYNEYKRFERIGRFDLNCLPHG